MEKSKNSIVNSSSTPRLLYSRDVRELLVCSRVHLWRLVKEGKVPPPFKLTARRNAWREDEFVQWLSNRPLVAYGKKKGV
jgi:predicted DNA-binding transcriptional regulator AlpA